MALQNAPGKLWVHPALSHVVAGPLPQKLHVVGPLPFPAQGLSELTPEFRKQTQQPNGPRTSFWFRNKDNIRHQLYHPRRAILKSLDYPQDPDLVL
eukprot:3219814-Pyramimonas_sp.AAC.1